ncbi:MAG: HEAT repeat domain-containing protein [Sphingobacteriaceae bacterium]
MNSFTSYFIDYSQFPELIQSALLIVAICLIGLSHMYSYIVFTRLYKAVNARFMAKWKQRINQLLSELVADDDLATAQCVEKYTHLFKVLPLKRKPIKLLVEAEIVRFHQEFTGKTAEVLRELFLALKLEKLAYKRLKDSNWENRVLGIKILAQLNVRWAAPKLLALCDDEVGTLRMEAQAAFLKLSDEAPFRFLDRATEHILEWHQLELLEVINKAKGLSLPSFSKWLTAKNDTVVILCLKLIRQYQQFDALPYLVELLDHKNSHIRLLAIELLGQFEAYAYETELLQRYPSASQAEKLAILHAIGQIASGEQLDFLQAQLLEESYELVFQALMAIKNHGAKGTRLLDKIYQSALPNKRQMIDHLLDHRLNY